MQYILQDTDSKLPSPLPYPPFSQAVLEAEKNGSVLRVRARLIKEAARYYLSLCFDLSNSYHHICQLLVTHFPALKDAIVLPGASCNYVSLSIEE